MNLEDLKANWKKQHSQMAPDRFEALATAAVAKTERFEGALRRRDLLEAASAVVVVMFISAFMWLVPSPTMMQVGLVIIMVGAVEIVVVMYWTRHRDDKSRHDLPLVDFCESEIKRVERQIQLLRNVNWWYSGPLMFGCCVMIYGLLSSIPDLPSRIKYGFLAAFYACFLAAGFIIYRINIQAVESDLIPMRSELAELLHSLKEGSSESHGT